MSKKENNTMPDLGQLFGMLAQQATRNPNELPKWHEQYEYPMTSVVNIETFLNYARTAMFFQALQYGCTVTENWNKCISRIDLKIEEVINSFEKINAKLIYRSMNKLFFSFEHGVCFCDFYDECLYLTTIVHNLTEYEKIKQLLENFKA